MAQAKFFRGAGIIKVNGEAPIENGGLLIKDGKIIAVGKAGDIMPGAETEIVETCGKWIMPGMIDAHVHIVMDPDDPGSNTAKENPYTLAIRSVGNLEKYLKAGVTYIRDAGSPDYVNLEVKRCLDAGMIAGPGMITCGRAITITGGHGKQWGIIADGIEEVRKATRHLILSGADYIKVIASDKQDNEFMLTREEIGTAVEEARRAHKKTMAHATSLTGIKNAVYAGVESIDHASVLDDEVIQAMLDRGTYIVPTLTAGYFSLQYCKENGGDPETIAYYEARQAEEIISLKKAYKAGVPIALGTDSGTRWNYHGVSSSIEIKLMVDAGMSNMDAIISSTKRAAEILGIDRDYGTLEIGKQADFVILNENPLTNIGVLSNPQHVYKSGKLYRRQ